MSLWVLEDIGSKKYKHGHLTIFFFAVENVWCVDNLPDLDSFLVVVQNLELTSSNMLNLCTKYLIRKFNYTPCHSSVIIISLTLFSMEQHFLSVVYHLFCAWSILVNFLIVLCHRPWSYTLWIAFSSFDTTKSVCLCICNLWYSFTWYTSLRWLLQWRSTTSNLANS